MSNPPLQQFGQLFQKFDADGDGRLGRGDFERMIGGLLGRLNEADGRDVGGGRERQGSRGNDQPVTPSTQTPPPPPPPTTTTTTAPSPSPMGPSITHYDETTGVPLAREAVASQQALGHTVVLLSEAYGRRLSRLQVSDILRFITTSLVGGAPFVVLGFVPQGSRRSHAVTRSLRPCVITGSASCTSTSVL